MMTNNIFETHGSITKKETFVPIESNVLVNTLVVEASNPYANYYGKYPKTSNPNSLYLFTNKFYQLDEVLEFTNEIEKFMGSKKRFDVASSIFDFTDQYYYAIRVNEFPDYKYIQWLQNCYLTEGVTFLGKVNMTNSASVTVFRKFILKEIFDGIFVNMKNSHKAYIIIPKQISNNDFLDLMVKIRNNVDCELFDVALGNLFYNLNTNHIIRIYSENLNNDMLKCIKAKIFSNLA